MANTANAVITVDFARSRRSLQPMLMAYSEWLDQQGLVVSDKGPEADKRPHADLVDEFLAFCGMAE